MGGAAAAAPAVLTLKRPCLRPSPLPPSHHHHYHHHPCCLPQDLVYQGEGLLPVLRLLLLYCVVHGGIPKRYYENLR